jgi:serine/threonine-protein kinase
MRVAAENESRDTQLAALLAALTDELRQGRAPDVDAVAREHPGLAQELRELWAAALLAEGMGQSRTRSTLSVPSTSSMPIEPAPTTVGDYEILEQIGRGGMGVVYRARQRSLGRQVALKMILRGDLASPVDLARFRAEASAAARLEHPHIVPVYDVGSSDGRTYFSMKYVEGRTLAQLLAEGPLPPREAARLVATISRAIHHAHQQGVLHRDLKPSNILLEGQTEEQGQRAKGKGQRENAPEQSVAADSSPSPFALSPLPFTLCPLVTDFGLAKRVEGGESLTQTGAIVGTPSYMSPEQAAGSRGVLSPASDVYSLGAILYECLTGRPPLQAATPMDTLFLVLEQAPMPPRMLNRKVDRALEMICLKCLEKPPELRYASAAQLADDLDAYLAGEPVSALSGMRYRVTRLLSETHHAGVLENWGLLWMWHSLAVLVFCSLTNWLYLRNVDSPMPYIALWTVGFGAWASIFLALRRRAGPVTFVERQIVHLWTGSTLGCMSLFFIERLLGLPVLTLSPVLAILSGMVFLVKASVLSGAFYIWAIACFVTAGWMAFAPDYGLFIFGVVSASGFFFPGLKYYRQHAARPAR